MKKRICRLFKHLSGKRSTTSISHYDTLESATSVVRKKSTKPTTVNLPWPLPPPSRPLFVDASARLPVLCDGCAQKHKKCGKCMEDKHVLKRYQKTEAEAHRDKQIFENKLAQMPERDRRKLMRRMEAMSKEQLEDLEEEVLKMDVKPSAEEEEEEVGVAMTEEDAMAAAMEAMEEEEDFDDLDIDDDNADEV